MKILGPTDYLMARGNLEVRIVIKMTVLMK